MINNFAVRPLASFRFSLIFLAGIQACCEVVVAPGFPLQECEQFVDRLPLLCRNDLNLQLI